MFFSEADAGNPSFVPKGNPVDAAKMRRLMAAYAKTDPALTQAERAWKTTTAHMFVLPSLRIVDAQAAAGGKIYTYRLDYAVSNAPFGDMTTHGFDIPMAFDQMSSPMGRKVHDLWSSFIRTGIPGRGLPSWPLYDLHSRNTMILGRTPHVAEDVMKLEREVWE